MKVKQIDNTGKEINEIQVDESLFGAPVNSALVSQYVHVHRQRKALGTKKTKARGEVSGGGHKPWRQKHTGHARQGSIRSPLWVGGGHTHAIRPDMNPRVKMSKKMRINALSSALTSSLQQSAIVFLSEIKLTAPKTKEIVTLLKNLSFEQNKVLFVTESKDVILEKSVANLPRVDAKEVRLLNAYDLINHDKIVFLGDAPKKLGQLYTK